MMDVKNKKITVIGIGASGKSAALFLKSKGALVYATDSGSSPEIEKTAGYLRKNGINAQTRRHTEDFIKSSTLIVISPGIPPDSPAVKWAKKYNIEIISEIELAYCFCPGRIIAVTGSNGKSTTATLIAQILKDAGKNVVLCGNIGNAFIDEIEKISKASYVVLEVSSFQLEGIKTFKPYICVILNVSQNHLDRHADFKEYFSAKKMIYRYQDKNNYAVLNYDDAELRALKGRVPSNLFFFSRRRRIRGAYAENDKLYLNITRPQFLSGTEKFKLKQPHNVENFLAAAVCASICKVPAASIKKTLAGFKGLPHHIEPVARINGVDFIDDSKSTTVDSTRAALRSLGTKVILIAGGRNKGSDFKPAKKEIKENVRALVLIGEAASQMKRQLGRFTESRKAVDMNDAVVIASKIAKKGESVLLSPMCASFDMFKSYKHRGDVFKQAVRHLK